MPAKLRCFVAMAFGQKDTDAIFKISRKTLARLGINAQRVDRIEHNENIDTRIISEIEAADLVSDKFCDGLPFDRQECMT
jgi:hypothetical protein